MGPEMNVTRTTFLIALLVCCGLLAPGCGLSEGQDESALSSSDVPNGALLRSRQPRESAPVLAEAEMALLIEGQQAFGLELLRASVARQGNRHVAISPLAVRGALSMAHAGASGLTATQLSSVLRIWLPGEQIYRGQNALEQELGQHARQVAMTLSVSRALWADSRLSIEPDYLALLARHWGAGLRLVDFGGNPDSARETVAAWMAEQAVPRASLPPGSLGEGVTLLSTQTMRVSAGWALPFDEARSAPALEVDAGGSGAIVMRRVGTYPVMREEGLEAVEVALEGERLAWLMMCPDDIEGFVEELDVVRYRGIVEALAPEDLELRMPRFTIDDDRLLGPALDAMGASALSGSTADFSRMSSDWPELAEVWHSTRMTIDERGVDLSGITEVRPMEPDMVASPPPGLPTNGGADPDKFNEALPQVSVEGPCIAVLRDRRRGAILLLARLSGD